MNALYDAYLERLEKLHREIEKALSGLPQEALDWTPGWAMNSLAVLVVHTAGSERYWIGDVAMGEPSGRDRSAEFAVHGLSAAELQARLERSLAYAREALPRLPENSLAVERYSAAWGENITAAWALMHALEHLGIHLGHIQMVRQLWDQRGNR